MKSGLTPLFSDADIDRWFDKFQERAEERIFKLLSAAGEKFVKWPVNRVTIQTAQAIFVLL